MYKNKIKTIGAYPSPFVNPKIKETKEYIKEYLQQMYSDWKYSENNIYRSKITEFEENRKFRKYND